MLHFFHVFPSSFLRALMASLRTAAHCLPISLERDSQSCLYKSQCNSGFLPKCTSPQHKLFCSSCQCKCIALFALCMRSCCWRNRRNCSASLRGACTSLQLHSAPSVTMQCRVYFFARKQNHPTVTSSAACFTSVVVGQRLHFTLVLYDAAWQFSLEHRSSHILQSLKTWPIIEV